MTITAEPLTVSENVSVTYIKNLFQSIELKINSVLQSLEGNIVQTYHCECGIY
jgi:hypothetical protein